MTTAPASSYTIRVDGHLDDHWSAWLGELDVTRDEDGTSTITISTADQAQLHGVLAGLRDIGAVITELRPTARASRGRFPPVAYSVVDIDDVEPGGPGGAVRFVRRELGVEAFGINWFELPPGAEGRQHDEAASGQEEVLVVVRGSGHWRVDGEEIPVRVGSFIRIDPESVRCPVAGPEGMTFLAIGARRGAYEPRGPF